MDFGQLLLGIVDVLKVVQMFKNCLAGVKTLGPAGGFSQGVQAFSISSGKRMASMAGLLRWCYTSISLSSSAGGALFARRFQRLQHGRVLLDQKRSAAPHRRGCAADQPEYAAHSRAAWEPCSWPRAAACPMRRNKSAHRHSALDPAIAEDHIGDVAGGAPRLRGR